MRHLSLVLVAFALLSAIACGHTTTNPPLLSAQANAQRDLDARFIEGMNRKDLDQVMACFWNSPDLFLVLPDATVIRGWENVRQGIQQFLAGHESVNLTIDEVSYVRSSDSVIAVGTATFRLQPRNGAAYQFTERWTDVRRNINGRWVYVLDHAHALPPPKTPGS